MTLFTLSAILVGLSALFGYANHRLLHLPHTIGLVVMALAASLAVIAFDLANPSVHIAREVTDILRRIDFNETLMHGMLSFLLFAGALHADFSALRDRSLTIGALAVIGTLVSTAAIGTAMWALAGLLGFELPFLWALVFGALISPTDPVAVLGLFRTVAVPGSLQAKISGESLFNDGLGVVLFSVVLALATAGGGAEGSPDAAAIARLFALEALGGAALGLAAGYIGYRAMHGIEEPSLEVMITLALVMVGYSLALALHMSGPIAMVVAGLFIGNRGVRYAMGEQTRAYVMTFWTLVDEILNSVLFLLIGLEVLVVAEGVAHPVLALLAIPVALLGRTLAVTIPLALLARWRTFTPGAVPVLIWGGLRGGIAVALALSLPENGYKGPLLVFTYAVVLFSIIVQGLTVKPLVRRMVGRGGGERDRAA